MTLWIEIAMWLAAGLVCAALMVRRRFALGALSSASVALAFAALVRSFRGLDLASFDPLALAAALVGAWLAAMVLRNMELPQPPPSRA